ncbi:MAG: aspartyl-phosphate phosphatase Spo0E family protein [Bacillota bacterium]
MYSHWLTDAIERVRDELSGQLLKTGYNFCDSKVIQTSRKLDRLLNLHYRYHYRQGTEQKTALVSASAVLFCLLGTKVNF